MPHEVVLYVQIYDKLNGKRLSIPVDLRYIGEPKDFYEQVRNMNSPGLTAWSTGHMVKRGTKDPITTSVITTFEEAIKKINMKAILSTTYDDKYLFNLPIVTWAWKKLGVDVICFLPDFNQADTPDKTELVARNCPNTVDFNFFKCSPEKAATYAQNSRLYGACLKINYTEKLIVSDCDMLVFPGILPYITADNSFSVLGVDLVPAGQLPMCYLWGSVQQWKDLMRLWGRNYQQCLDDALQNENCENIKGNLWARDQETAAKFIGRATDNVRYYDRARPGTQFAMNRLDRDDAFILDRLSPDIIDYHMHRPLWEPKNFEMLLTILKYFWPQEDFKWLADYREQYVKLL